MAYQPIESYGVIGDLHTVALVGMNDCSIDWCCFPHFDSPSIFARILDDKIGGHFKLAAATSGPRKQLYLPDTNVLLTRFLSEHAVGEVVDFMPVTRKRRRQESGGLMHQIIRRAKAVRGSVKFGLECFPAFDYARTKHKVHVDKRGAIFESDGMTVALLSPVPLKIKDSGVVAEFTLEADQEADFILCEEERARETDLLDTRVAVEDALQDTVYYWKRWLSRSKYTGRWREMVHRSALILKLMTYEPTGAIVAAPTCSLPEEIGGIRNWDYRFTWIRDASFTLYGLLRLGFTEEAGKFMTWLEARAQELGDEGLQIMYGIDGRHEIPETELTHLDGYRGSKPVRIGNAASGQLQLDIYGELMDSVYLYDKHGTPTSYDLWNHLWRLLHWVMNNWERKDEGIWEVRGGRQHFVYSKLLCWVALDRGLRLANKRSFPADRDRLARERDRIYQEIMTKGFNDKNNSFVQYFGTDALDASNLLMPLVFFISPTDRRMQGTLDATMKDLMSDSLVYRYQIGKGAGDGLSGEEGTFCMCTFWLVEALTRAGRLEDARMIFEKMLTYANHLGLYAEEIGPSGEALGNFPQAFTHLGLVSAAFNLDRKLGRGGI